MLEKDIQKMIVQYLRRQRIKHYSIPNEQTVKVLRMFKIKGDIPHKVRSILESMGMLKGAPDLALIPGKGKTYYMEVKQPKKGLTNAQPEVHAYLNENGYDVAIVHSLDEAIKIMTEWGII